MRNIIAIAKKDMIVAWTTPWGWVVLTAMLFVSGFFFMGLLVQFKEAHEQIRQMQGGWDAIGPEAQFLRNLTDGVVLPLFQTMIVMNAFIKPLISASGFAVERRQKTFELLMTAPVTSWEIVLGKYLGMLATVLATVGVLLLYPLILTAFGSSFSATTSERGATLEWGTVALGLGALFLWASTVVAAGLFFSSLTENVVVGAILTFAFVLLWILVELVGANWDGNARAIIEYFSVNGQLRNLMRGVLDLKPLVFFSSVIATFLVLTHRSVESRRWV